MRTGFRCRAYPTSVQQEVLSRTFGCARKVWNLTLAWRQARWRDTRTGTGYGEANAFLTQLKRDPQLAFLGEVSSVPLQQAIRTRQRAYTNFFAKRAGPARFKTRSGKQAAEYTRSGFRWRDGRLWLAKMDAPLDIVWSWPHIDPATVDPATVDPSTVVVSREPDGRRYVSLFADVPEPTPLPCSKTCSACGHLLDKLGLSTRAWACPGCGTLHDRDHNAAKNILAAGPAVTACGADVRHSGSPRVHSVMKQEPQPVRAGIPGQ